MFNIPDSPGAPGQGIDDIFDRLEIQIDQVALQPGGPVGIGITDNCTDCTNTTCLICPTHTCPCPPAGGGWH